MAEKINDGGLAFPHEFKYGDGTAQRCEGMTMRQYAAIHLRVPSSGTDWLDAMILESKRDELASKAMQAYFTDPDVGFGTDVVESGVSAGYRIAQAMLNRRSAK